MPNTAQHRVYIRDVDIAARLGISRNTVWRWAKEGRLPKPVQLSPGCTRWRSSDIENWEPSQVSA